MRAVALFLLMFVASGILICQNEEPASSGSVVHSLGVSVGVNDFHLKDEYLSPSIFAGGMFSTEILYQVKSKQIKHAVDFYFSTGHINSDVQPRDVTPYIGSASYSFFHTLQTWTIAEHPLEIYIGTGLSSFFAYTDFVAEDRAADYRYYDQSWYWSHSLDLHFLGEYQFDVNRSLLIKLTTPIVRLVSRPENGHEFNEKNMRIINSFFNAAKGGKPELFWENPAVLCELEYRGRITDRAEFRGAYSFTYISSDRPLSMGMYWNNFMVGISWLLH